MTTLLTDARKWQKDNTNPMDPWPKWRHPSQGRDSVPQRWRRTPGTGTCVQESGQWRPPPCPWSHTPSATRHRRPGLTSPPHSEWLGSHRPTSACPTTGRSGQRKCPSRPEGPWVLMEVLFTASHNNEKTCRGNQKWWEQTEPARPGCCCLKRWEWEYTEPATPAWNAGSGNTLNQLHLLEMLGVEIHWTSYTCLKCWEWKYTEPATPANTGWNAGRWNTQSQLHQLTLAEMLADGIHRASYTC